MRNEIKILISFITLLICLFFREQLDGGLLLQVIGLLVFLVGGTMAILGGLALGENLTLSHHPKALVTTGIYLKIRNPMDYGGILISIGFAAYLMSLFGLILAIFLVTPLHIHTVMVEEKILSKKYGEKYENYKENTLF